MKNKQTNNGMVLSFMTIRRAVGWLGIVLAPVLLVGNYAFSKCGGIQDSISHYYFTIVGEVFVGTLCAVALFLFTYKGFDKLDNWSCNFAGFFALGVALFATNNNSADSCSVLDIKDHLWRATVHYTSATLFFLTLAFISFYLFTKSTGNKTPEKRKRNKLYRTCAVIMIICLILILLTHIFGWEKFNSPHFKIVFLLETLALWAFGLSWLTKGEFILKDHAD